MSLAFNGTSSKLTWAGAAVAELPFTLFCWIKPTSASASGMVFGAGDFGGAQELAVYADGAGAGSKVKALSNAGGSVAAASTTPLSTAWQPAMAVFTSATSRKIYYANGAVVSDTSSNALTFSGFDRIVVGCRPITDTVWFNGLIAEAACWSSALTQADFDALAAGAFPETIATGSLIDSWSLETQSATQVGTVSRTLTANNTTQGATHPISRSLGDTITATIGTATASGYSAAIIGAVTIACSLGGATASGHQATVSTGSNVTISATLGTATASGYSASVVSAGSATITTDVFKNNTGTILASTVIPKLAAIKLSDMTVAASWTSQATNGSGILSLTGAMTAATDYLLVVSSADGAAVGVKKYTAT